MMGPIMIFLFAVGVSVYEVPRLLKQDTKKDLAVYAIVLLIGTSLSIAMALNLPVPNPLDLFEFIFEPSSKWINHILGVRRS